MSGPSQCPPAQVETVRHARFLGRQPVPAGQRAEVLGVAADTRFVYATYHCTATDPAPGELVVLDQARLADPAADPVVARVPVGHRPRAVAVNPRTGKVYVLDAGRPDSGPGLWVVGRDGAGTFALVARITLAAGVVDVAVNPRTNRVYVSNRGRAATPAPGTIHVVDGAADVELPASAIPVPGPRGLAFDEATDTLYAALSDGPDGSAVAAISCAADGSTHTVRRTVPVPATSRALAVAVLAGGDLHRLYLGSAGSTVTRLELDGTFRAATVRTGSGGPVSLAADPHAELVYLATDAGFQVLDAVGGTVSAPLRLGPLPRSVAVDAAGRAAVGDGADGTLTTVLPVVTTGPVGEHWIESGGGLGQPVTGYRLLPGGDPRAGYQVFERGAVFASTDYGAVVLSRELTAAWEAQAARPHPTGGTVQEFLGLPVEPAAEGSAAATFQRGLVFRPAARSRLDRVPPRPETELFLEGVQGFVAALTGDAVVAQVTDGAGRTLFEPGRAPSRWPDLRRDPAGRIPALVPLPTGGPAVLFFGTGRDVTHTYELTGAGPYRFGLRAPALDVLLTGHGGPVADLVTASRLGTADRSVAFAVPAGGTAKEVSLVLDALPCSARGKQFRLDGLAVAPGQRIAARLRDGGRELLLDNAGGASTVRLRIRPGPGAAPTTAREVPLAAGAVTRIRPADWRPAAIGSAPLRVEVRGTVDGPPVRCLEL